MSTEIVDESAHAIAFNGAFHGWLETTHPEAAAQLEWVTEQGGRLFPAPGFATLATEYANEYQAASG